MDNTLIFVDDGFFGLVKKHFGERKHIVINKGGSLFWDRNL